jgi:septal ring factor EnvC (AmiA/AmiB activator)
MVNIFGKCAGCFYFIVTVRGKRKEERGKRINLSYLFSFLLYLSSAVFAQDPSQKQLELEANITNSQALFQQQQQEITSIETQLGDLGAQLDAQIAERDRVSNELAALREEQATLTESIAMLETQLAETQSRLGELQVQVADLKVRVQELLVGVYKQRSGRYARVLTQADSLHDLQVKNYYLSLLSDQDVDLVTELSVKATELITLQDAQNQQMNELQTQKTALEGNQVALEIAQGDLETIIANLDATKEGQLATRKDLLESQASLEASIAESQNQLQAEIKRLQEEAAEKRRLAALAADAIQRDQLNKEADQVEQRATNLSAPRPAMVSGYISPVANGEIYLAFGKCGRCIALRANSAGAPVFAAQSGVVLTADFLSANDGYLVSVQQENGIIIAYSNLQKSPPVKVGDQVAQGDTLGYLGGGGVIPADVLKLYVRTGQNEFVDPASVLGF